MFSDSGLLCVPPSDSLAFLWKVFLSWSHFLSFCILYTKIACLMCLKYFLGIQWVLLFILLNHPLMNIPFILRHSSVLWIICSIISFLTYPKLWKIYNIWFRMFAISVLMSRYVNHSNWTGLDIWCCYIRSKEVTFCWHGIHKACAGEVNLSAWPLLIRRWLPVVLLGQ